MTKGHIDQSDSCFVGDESDSAEKGEASHQNKDSIFMRFLG